jgi:Mn-containing catalase
MVQDSMGKPWSGDYVNATGDLIGDLTHNFFLETGARNNKLKVYEAVDHPAARALTGYLLVRGGVHQVAYARALENLHELAAVFNGPHPETGEELEVAEELHPEGALAYDLPEQPAVFAPGPEAGEIEEIAQKLRQAAGLPKKPTGEVANK